jgi:hypothetical protein
MKQFLQKLEKIRVKYSHENNRVFRFNKWLNRSKCKVKFYDFNYELVKVNYVDTDIVTFINQDDRKAIILNNDDYFTVTTKKYMNELLNYFSIRIFQKNFTWYIQIKGKILEYNNNMVIELDNDSLMAISVNNNSEVLA